MQAYGFRTTRWEKRSNEGQANFQACRQIEYTVSFVFFACECNAVRSTAAKKKLLWGSKAKVTTSEAPAAIGDSVSAFSDPREQAKFLKLLGVKNVEPHDYVMIGNRLSK